MGELLHLVQRGGAWAGWGPTQSPSCCTKCNSPPISGQCTNHYIASPLLCGFNVVKRVKLQLQVQWLQRTSWLCGAVVECWSLTGKLSLCCTRPAADRCVGNPSTIGQPTRPTQPFILLGSIDGIPTKIRLLESLVWPVVSYGWESWSLKSTDEDRIIIRNKNIQTNFTSHVDGQKD